MAEQRTTESRKSKVDWGAALGRKLIQSSSVIAVLVAWEISCKGFDIPRYILPAPSSIAAEIWKQRAVLFTNSIPTLEIILLGFGLAIVVGLPLAILIVWSTPLKLALYPLLVSSQTVPKVAIAPLLVLWLGYGIFPKVLVTFLICFFPITIDAVVGLRSVPTETIFCLHARSAPAVGKLLSRSNYRMHCPTSSVA